MGDLREDLIRLAEEWEHGDAMVTRWRNTRPSEYAAAIREILASHPAPSPSVSRDASWYEADGSTVMLPAEEVERRRSEDAPLPLDPLIDRVVLGSIVDDMAREAHDETRPREERLALVTYLARLRALAGLQAPSPAARTATTGAEDECPHYAHDEEGPLMPARMECSDCADEDRERIANTVTEVVQSLADGDLPTCECGNDAVCVGVTEGRLETLAVMCDECCGHGNEDGWCVPLAKFYPSKRAHPGEVERDPVRTAAAKYVAARDAWFAWLADKSQSRDDRETDRLSKAHDAALGALRRALAASSSGDDEGALRKRVEKRLREMREEAERGFIYGHARTSPDWTEAVNRYGAAIASLRRALAAPSPDTGSETSHPHDDPGPGPAEE